MVIVMCDGCYTNWDWSKLIQVGTEEDFGQDIFLCPNCLDHYKEGEQ
jgi:hypothetical protein